MKLVIASAASILAMMTPSMAFATCAGDCRAYCGAQYPGDRAGTAACTDGCLHNCPRPTLPNS